MSREWASTPALRPDRRHDNEGAHSPFSEKPFAEPDVPPLSVASLFVVIWKAVAGLLANLSEPAKSPVKTVGARFSNFENQRNARRLAYVKPSARKGKNDVSVLQW